MLKDLNPRKCWLLCRDQKQIGSCLRRARGPQKSDGNCHHLDGGDGITGVDLWPILKCQTVHFKCGHLNYTLIKLLVFLFVVCLFFPYLATSCGVPGARDQIPATGETHTTVWGNTGSFNPRCQGGDGTCGLALQRCTNPVCHSWKATRL